MRALIAAMALVAPMALLLPVVQAQLLEADLERAVVLWQGSKYLYRSDKSEDRWLEFYVNPSDAASMPGEYLVIVVETGRIDTLAGRTPRIRVCVQPLGYGSAAWCSGWISVAANGVYEIPVAKKYLLGYFDRPTRLFVELIWWRLPYAGDKGYGVEVRKVSLCPSKAVGGDEVEMGVKWYDPSGYPIPTKRIPTRTLAVSEGTPYPMGAMGTGNTVSLPLAVVILAAVAAIAILLWRR